MIDTHAHLDDPRFDDDRPEVIARARQAGIHAIIDVGIDLERSRRAVALAKEWDEVYAAVGLHPASVVADPRAEIEAIEALAKESSEVVVAIGEIGLDFYWKEVDPQDQHARLEAQLDLALRLELPAIFHVRDALDETLRTLASRSRLPRGVFHCFSGGPRDLERVVELGFHASFCGNVTYPRSEDLREAARAIPLDRLLLETDCPYLAPQPARGKRNEPAFVAHTRDALAVLHGLDPAELEAITDRNSHELFRFPPKAR